MQHAWDRGKMHTEIWLHRNKICGIIMGREVADWIYLVQDGKWSAFVNMTMNVWAV